MKIQLCAFLTFALCVSTCTLQSHQALQNKDTFATICKHLSDLEKISLALTSTTTYQILGYFIKWRKEYVAIRKRTPNVLYAQTKFSCLSENDYIINPQNSKKLRPILWLDLIVKDLECEANEEKKKCYLEFLQRDLTEYIFRSEPLLHKQRFGLVHFILKENDHDLADIIYSQIFSQFLSSSNIDELEDAVELLVNLGREYHKDRNMRFWSFHLISLCVLDNLLTALSAKKTTLDGRYLRHTRIQLKSILFFMFKNTNMGLPAGLALIFGINGLDKIKRRRKFIEYCFSAPYSPQTLQMNSEQKLEFLVKNLNYRGTVQFYSRIPGFPPQRLFLNLLTSVDFGPEVMSNLEVLKNLVDKNGTFCMLNAAKRSALFGTLVLNAECCKYLSTALIQSRDITIRVLECSTWFLYALGRAMSRHYQNGDINKHDMDNFRKLILE